MKKSTRPATYGLMAEFDDPSAVVAAAQKVYDEGYRSIDAYSPYPIEALSEAIGVHSTRMPLLVLIGGILGLIGGYAMQYYTHVIDYPIIVGGRPFHSWPSFIPITFETTVLGASLAAVFGMLALNGLPEPYHPVFNAPRFSLASSDRFFLVIKAKDPKFSLEGTRDFLAGLKATEVVSVDE